MILVTLGTQNNDFKRILEEIERNIEDGTITDDVVVQKGYTKFESKKMTLYNELSKDEMNKLIKKADLVITHGGVGSIIGAITQGKKVIAIPRLKRYNEHVNDHQLDIVKSFDEMGYIIGISDEKELKRALKRAQKFIPKKYIRNTGHIIEIIDDFITNN